MELWYGSTLEVTGGGWSVRSGTGASRVIEDAPVFFAGGEVTWREPA